MSLRTMLLSAGTLTFALWAAPPLSAQIAAVPGPLPEAITRQAIDYLNSPEVLRLAGGARLPEGSRVEGDVAVLGGSLIVGGVLEGDLLVVNGDLQLLPGAHVQGQILIIGGGVTGDEEAQIDGPAEAYASPLRYRVRQGRVELLPDPGLTPGFLSTDLGFGQARFTLRTGPAYNRVEGLPVRLGPIIQTSGSNPLLLEAFAIWRSVSGFSIESERLGYGFRLDQALGGRGVTSIGVSAHSETTAVDDRGMSDLESSLSTFLLRRDLRDHFDREGWSVYWRIDPVRIPLEAQVTLREEEHRTPPLRNPWTLRDSNAPWRPLSLMGEGRHQSIEAELHWDSADDPIHPSTGWQVSLGVRRQVGGELRLPPSAPEGSDPSDLPLEPAQPLPRFSQGSLDVRRYTRVGPTSRLKVRAAVAGALGDTPLPPQFQTSLGGEGSLPGHPRFSIDCGARSQLRLAPTGEEQDSGEREVQRVYPTYGCDRTALFQAEFQGRFPLSWNPVPDEWGESELASLADLHPVWAIFFNAGRGWQRGDLGNGGVRADSPTRADVGIGFFVGSLGLYWSHPLNHRDQGVNFSVRLQRRF